MLDFGRPISDTCGAEKEKCDVEGVSWQTLLMQKCALFMSVMKNKFFGDHFCPPTLVEGDYSNGFVCPSFRPSARPPVRRHNLVSATSPTVFKGF